jgi:predicted ATPase
VHWIDRTSEEFLMTLVERMTAARVMVITTGRPGYRAPWMDRSYVTQMTLAPLTTAESAQLVESVVLERPLSHDVATAILQRAEGNPFFLEELTRTVAEEGPDPDTIPNTVHGVIMARLDRLSESAKRLLQMASVLGREVPLALLRHVWRGTRDFTSDLVELSRLEFLYERPDSDDVVYVFKHALTRDVAYDSLLARDRRELHLATARALHELYADRLDEMAATLAYHYTRTDLGDEAVIWLIRAADQAARMYANTEALLHLDLAKRRVERLTEGPARDRLTMDVALRRAFILTTVGRHKECLELLRAHASLQKCVPVAALASEYFLRLALSHAFLSEIAESRAAAEAALREGERAGSSDCIGKALYALAACSYACGASRDAVAYDSRAIPLLGEPRTRYWLGLVYWNQAANQHVIGDFESALGAATECERVAEAIGDRKLEALAQCIRSRVHLSRGDAQQAFECAQRALDTSRDPIVTFTASKELGYAQCEAGDARAAIRTFEGMLEKRESTPVQLTTVLALCGLGEAYLLAGEIDRVEATARQALDVNAGLNPFTGALAGRLLGRVALARGQTDVCDSHLTGALEAFERCGASFEAARTHLDLARMLMSRGDPTGVRSHAGAAIRAFERAGAPRRAASVLELTGTRGR